MQDLKVWVLVTMIGVALVVTLAIGLALSGGLGLNDNGGNGSGGNNNGKTGIIQDHNHTYICPRTPRYSPLYSEPSTSREGHYSHAAVAMDALIGSKLGSMKMELKRASAMDTAISAVFVAGVTNPHLSGIGGGHFVTYYNRNSKEVHTINGREQAPSGATADMFSEAKQTSSEIGGMSIGVPGEVLGLYNAWMLGNGGYIAWEHILKPAILLCKQGFYVGPSLLHAMHSIKNMDEMPVSFREFITNPATGKIYEKGDIMFRPQLAKTLTIIASEGPYAFYNGSLAENITLDIADAGGNITMDDLAGYTAPVKPAIKSSLRGNMNVYSPPPPSGGLVYQYILNILNGYKMTKKSVSTVDKALKTYHRIIEAFKHAFAVRSELGDCDVETEDVKAAIQQLGMKMMDPNYGQETRARISDTKTYGHTYYNPKYSNAWDNTATHFSVVGPNGDAVSITSTINSDFGSKVFGTRTGILFNNEMDNFSKTNSYAEASPANQVAPRKRPMSSMSPSIVVDGYGDAKLVIGASGGPKLITASALTTIETLWFGRSIKEAIDYPRIHHQLFPEEIHVELGFPQALIDGLRSMGHNLTMYPSASSVVQGIQRTGHMQLSANSDYREYGEAQGFK